VNGPTWIPPTTRAYGAQAQRAQSRRTLVYSEDDIRRNITDAAASGKACDLELAANVALSAPITLPYELRAFSLSGSTQFRLLLARPLSSVFVCDMLTDFVGTNPLRRVATFDGIRIVENGQGGTTVFGGGSASTPRAIVVRDLFIETESGSSWQVLGDSVNFWRCRFDGLSANGLGTVELVGGAHLHDSVLTVAGEAGTGNMTCVLTHANANDNIFVHLSIVGDIDSSAVTGGNVFINPQTSGGTATFNDADVVLTPATSLTDAPSVLPGWVGIGTAAPDSKLHVKESDAAATPNANAIATFEKNGTGYLQLLVPDTSEMGLLFGIPGSAADGGIIYNTSGDNAMRLRTGGNNTRIFISSAGLVGILTASPAVALDIAGGLRTRGKSVSLTADNQVVNVGDYSYIQLSSNNATAANRTFVLDQGAGSGHRLTLEWTGTNAGELVDDSAVDGGGNHRLAGTWTPTQYDTISLIWNGTDWVELCRSTN
jgi:hypothetical protein